MNQPKVFVGITSYNHQDYIYECLESVVKQSYPNIHIVVADDKSKDSTVAVIEKFIKDYPAASIRLIKNDPNLGISQNVNQLIKQVTDEKYVSLFSGDDIMVTDRIESLVKELEEHPTASFAFSDMEWFLSSTGKKIVNHYGLMNRPTVELKKILVENSIPSPTIMYRYSIMKGVLYNENLKYINDHMFIIELLVRGEGRFINKPLVRYRKHGEAASIVQTYYEDRLTLLSILKERFSHDHPEIINGYSKLVAYSSCLELQKNGKKAEAFKWMLKTFPAPFTSLKWLGRSAYMLRGFLK